MEKIYLYLNYMYTGIKTPPPLNKKNPCKQNQNNKSYYKNEKSQKFNFILNSPPVSIS